MYNIHVRICIRLRSWVLFVFVFVQENNNLLHSKFTRYSKKTNQEGVVLQIFKLISSMESNKKSFDILSTILRLVGSSNLGINYFQIFESIWIFKYIGRYIFWIIFLFIFVTQGVQNNIHIFTPMICLLQIIFIFVFIL